MKRTAVVLLLTFTVSCERIRSPILSESSDFTPTGHVIGTAGETMRLCIRELVLTQYCLSADSNTIQIDHPHCFLVPACEMIQVAQNLSDTTIFHWEFMTAVTPYPDDECVLLAYFVNLEGYMCSIGTGSDAGVILQKLIEPLSGDARSELDAAANTLLSL